MDKYKFYFDIKSKNEDAPKVLFRPSNDNIIILTIRFKQDHTFEAGELVCSFYMIIPKN